ncbi:MAG: response regulator [Chloroflexi bacterium]|nr:response regulator [Chloroflexota bacterium]
MQSHNTGRVLVVDDDEDTREVVRELLTDEGYEVGSVANTGSALETLTHWPPDVILLDLRLPGGDGRSFVQSYRDRPGPHAPIVLFTALGNPDDLAVEVGADDVLAKPFELEALLATVAKYTRRA